MEHEFIVFFLNYCLAHYFKSKAEMAREIGVGVSTLMRVMNPPYRFKAGSVPFQNMLWYCFEHEIDAARIFTLYKTGNAKLSDDIGSLTLHSPSLWERSCLGDVERLIYGDALLPDRHRAYLLRMICELRSCLCCQCTRNNMLTDHFECLPMSILQRALRYYQINS